ncbi:MAG: hypothetical protein KGN16_04975 [Burkholderiales bacterium]|nr:hypothetical protein [Burkholderiales bacterium]
MTRPDSESISTPRRVLLRIAVGAAAGPWAAARAQAVAGPATQLLQARLPALPSHGLPFEVRTDGETRGENRVVFGALRSTAAIDTIALIDPAQRQLWRRTPVDLGWTPRDQTGRPDWGDAIVLPEIRNAAAGRWTLLIERAPARAGAGQLRLAWQVLPRYELLMQASATEVAAGQTLLVTLRPLDYGVELRGLKAIVLSWADARGATTGHVQALENARSPEGIAVSSEPGAYIARLALPQPGVYRLQASQVFGQAPRLTTRSASIELNVGRRGGALRLASVQPDGATSNGCARGLRFRFDVDVAEPGNYVCNLLLLAGAPVAPRASGSAPLAAGHGTIDVVVSAEKWRAAGAPARLARVTLLRIDEQGYKLLADIEDLTLADHPIDGAALCR